jgi:hypothetical protein
MIEVEFQNNDRGARIAWVTMLVPPRIGETVRLDTVRIGRGTTEKFRVSAVEHEFSDINGRHRLIVRLIRI